MAALTRAKDDSVLSDLPQRPSLRRHRSETGTLDMRLESLSDLSLLSGESKEVQIDAQEGGSGAVERVVQALFPFAGRCEVCQIHTSFRFVVLS